MKLCSAVCDQMALFCYEEQQYYLTLETFYCVKKKLSNKVFMLKIRRHECFFWNC